MRWLVASVRTIDAAATVDVAVAAQDGHVVACVQCEAMKYDVRFGEHVNQRVAAKVLDREFAGVLNLAWFEHITCSDDGGALDAGRLSRDRRQGLTRRSPGRTPGASSFASLSRYAGRGLGCG